MGFRFRLQPRKLPGSPDIVLTRYRAVIFVHGCFWHRHKGCLLASTPKSHRKFWLGKFAMNVERDRKVARQLRKLGWMVHVVWECESDDPDRLCRRLAKFFSERVRQPPLRRPSPR
jgi:DNA mismatch endonuclease (patch repair protein)